MLICIVRLWRITYRIINGVSTEESLDLAEVLLKDGTQIKDVKFTDDDTLMIAHKLESTLKPLQAHMTLITFDSVIRTVVHTV